jgi:hypothetical protein
MTAERKAEQRCAKCGEERTARCGDLHCDAECDWFGHGEPDGCHPFVPLPTESEPERDIREVKEKAMSEKKTFKVYGTVRVGVTITVEAADEQEAYKEADQLFPGLTHYVGNGGTDQIVGVNDSNVSLDVSGYDPADWISVVELAS